MVTSIRSGQQLILAHCDDLACSDAIVSIVDNSFHGSLYSSIAVGPDGLPVISSFDRLRRDLKVAHCPDPVTCVPE